MMSHVAGLFSATNLNMYHRREEISEADVSLSRYSVQLSKDRQNMQDDSVAL